LQRLRARALIKRFGRVSYTPPTKAAKRRTQIKEPLMAAQNNTIIIAGLGNPGDEYAHTRHNAGFDAIDALADTARVSYWKDEAGAKTATFTMNIAEGGAKQFGFSAGNAIEVLLVKPQSFMNTSGGPISKIARAHEVTPERLIVIHDDLDLDPGRIRVKTGGRDAGHNGLKSIIAKMGSKDFHHIKVGIGRPPGRMPVVDWVLGAPKKDDGELFAQTCARAGEAAQFLIENGLVKTQDRFN
jgi:PTH1 family peptidyl-tRNA hydrolase